MAQLHLSSFLLLCPRIAWIVCAAIFKRPEEGFIPIEDLSEAIIRDLMAELIGIDMNDHLVNQTMVLRSGFLRHVITP